MLSRLISFSLMAVSCANALNSSECPGPRGEVDLNRYAGVWWDYEQSRNNIFHFGKYPISYWYEPEDGISDVVVTSYSTIKDDWDTTILAEGFNNGHNLGMNFELPILGNLYREYNIHTDYVHYSLAWHCEIVNNTRVVYANVFSREKEPNVDIEEIKRRVFEDELGIEVPPMDRVDQSGSPPPLDF